MAATTPSLSILMPLRRFGWRHRRSFFQGVAATVAVVILRLAMPWPLRGVIEVAFPGASQRGSSLLAHLPFAGSWWGDPLILLCFCYLAIAVASGLAEMAQRICMVRFTAQTVHDLRRAALAAMARRARTVRAADGDLIARLVGDIGRLKADVIGILVHVTTDALLFLAVAALFVFFISPEMGLYFLAGGLAASWIGLRAASPLERVASRARAHEGAYADTIAQMLERGHMTAPIPPPGNQDDDADVDREAHGARIVALASLSVHAVLGATVVAAVLVGVSRIRAGLLAPGELFLFIAYALLVHRRLVQAGRQLARLGKVRASLARVAPLLDGSDAVTPASNPSGGAPRRLRQVLALRGMRLAPVRGHRQRVDALDLEVAAGLKIAVLGRVGDGKSSLLRCLAGVEPAAEGTLLWDGEPLAGLDARLANSVGFLPQDPIFGPDALWRILGLPGPDATGLPQAEILRRIGVMDLIERLPKGLRQKVGSSSVSCNERRAIGLGAAMLAPVSLLVLDSPLEGLSHRASIERLRGIIDGTADKTLILSLPHLYEPALFDRVVVLRRGRIRFDGTPEAWRAWKEPEEGAERAVV